MDRPGTQDSALRTLYSELLTAEFKVLSSESSRVASVGESAR